MNQSEVKGKMRKRGQAREKFQLLSRHCVSEEICRLFLLLLPQHWEWGFTKNVIWKWIFFPALIIFVYVSSVFSLFFSLSVNWCQHWFEFFPNPPVNILGMVENVLVHHDKKLMQHFVSCHVTSQVRPRKASAYSYPQSGTHYSPTW